MPMIAMLVLQGFGSFFGWKIEQDRLFAGCRDRLFEHTNRLFGRREHHQVAGRFRTGEVRLRDADKVLSFAGCESNGCGMLRRYSEAGARCCG